jgi:hypothetical protein
MDTLERILNLGAPHLDVKVVRRIGLVFGDFELGQRNVKNLSRLE